ncbi:MAG: class I SAM-dependent methyltransferase [bacterium]|nr:class I SAM-dependent methyltransferase [bacterium]MBU1918566.1 class I SAM-dependent methyltransferase [bacterium]
MTFLSPAATPFAQQVLLAKAWEHVYNYPDIPIIERCLHRTEGGHLVLGCASGREFIPTLETKRPVVGIDGNPNMLRVASERFVTAFNSNQLRLIEGDFTCVPFPKQQGLITCMGNTWPYVKERDGRRQLFEKSHDCLATGGLLVVVIRQNYPLGNTSREQIIDTDDIGQIKFNVRWEDSPDGLIRTYYAKLEVGDTSEDIEVPIALFTYNEFLEDALEVGFVQDEVFGDYDMSPYTPDSRYHIHLLKKVI